MIPTTPIARRRFTAGRTPRPAQFRVARCRIGACADPRLPEVSGCEACRRIGIERRRAELAEVTA